jgi:ATP-dependent Lon protease
MQITREGEVFEAGDRQPLLPLRDVVIFPYMIIPLLVGRSPSLKALETAMEGEKFIVTAAQKGAEVSEPGVRDIHRVGTLCRMLQLLRLPDGTMRVLVEGLARVRISRFVRTGELFVVQVRPFDESHPADPEVEALMRTTRGQFEEYVRLHRKIPNEILISVNTIQDPRRLVNVMSAHLSSRQEVKQELLATVDLRTQLVQLSRLLNEELEILGIERKIEGEVRSQVHRNQREFYLSEQLKAIRKELGEGGDLGSDVDDLEEQVRKAGMPAEAEKKAMREVDRLRKMAPLSPEATVARTYVEWLVALPWSKRTRDRLDIAAAERILDEDHYGLRKVKERLLEYLAVLKLVNHLKGPILCFVGPPGVGKTSLGRSIARALGRRFVRVSLGGIRDEAEIRGHRRTYIGSMPGRIIQRLRTAGTRNPVFLLDEVDKLGADFRGDPAAALLEVLDPEQNHCFNDHYLDLDFDLSDVLFIATANVLEPIPPALRDRTEVIRLPGYLEDEKVAIARQFLIPRNMKSHGLGKSEIAWREGAVRTLIRSYTREAGVRNLEREIAGICRKLAREEVERLAGPAGKAAGESAPGKKAKGAKGGAKKARKGRTAVTGADVRRFLGPLRFPSRQVRAKDTVGVAAGLAWTEAGGDVLLVEAVALPGRGKLILTGKLGEVMKESGRAALSFARTRAAALGLEPDFYERVDIHVHIPEGAIPKDGPSAGITMAIAVLSALSGLPVRRDVAMTGEITLNGEVLAIGGLNEKVVAARRAGYRVVIVPEENRKDLPELPKNVTRGLTIHLVRTMDEALRTALAVELPGPLPVRSATPPRGARRSPGGERPPNDLAH